ncbi:Gfo/Idh/MocA family oxidoreductase [Aureibaculum conchae]|uniref:Gfo/Idh/MocA family oxidoreductase n=1 Tax=Aureibaculum sp. 2308TA14-22 TaxID=3108392 RepID=UPI003392DAD0
MKTINTAICSFGMSGQIFHAPFVELNPKFNLYGVLERTKNIAQDKYPNIKTFRTLDELLQDDAIELIIVNTPNITHYDFTKKVIKAGKHVVVEKPFTVTSKEAQELITLAQKSNLKISVYQNRRFTSDFKTVKRVINEGVLGDIVEAEFHFDRFVPELSYKQHKEIPTVGVGNLYDLGSHLVDQALQLFGMPTAVFASLDSFRKNSKVHDYFDVKLFYQSHYVILKSSYFVREPLPAYSIHGTKGSFIKTQADIQEAELQKGIKPNTEGWGIEPETERGLLHIMRNGKSVKELVTTEKGNYMTYFDGMYNAIRNDMPVPVSAYEGKQVIEVIEAAIQSNKDKKVIQF